MVDIKVLGPEIILFTIALIFVAILTKVIGCGISARLRGMNIKDSLIIGFGMSPRGEVAMIVALIGLNQGIIGQNIFASLVMMSLITTIIAPIVIKRIYGGKPKFKIKYPNRYV